MTILITCMVEVMKIIKLSVAFLVGCVPLQSSAIEKTKCGDAFVELESICNFNIMLEESSVYPVCESQIVRYGKMTYEKSKVLLGTDLDSGKRTPYLDSVVNSIYCESDNQIVMRVGNGGSCDQCEWYVLGNSVSGEILDSRVEEFPLKHLNHDPVMTLQKK